MRMNEDKKATFYDSLSEEEKAVSIPYYVHEWEMFRMERINKRLFAAFLVVLVMLFVTNAAWIWYENQFEEIHIEQEGSTDSGGSNYFNGTGELSIYGESEASNQDPQAQDGR